MAESAVNDFCRLCKENCRKGGRITQTKKIYDREGAGNGRSLFERLAAVGLRLRPRGDRSFRICYKCNRLVRTIEDALLTLGKWKRNEEETGGGPELQADSGGQPATTTPRTTTTPPPQTVFDPSIDTTPPPATEKRTGERPRETPWPAKRPRRLHHGVMSPPPKTPGTRQSAIRVLIQYPSGKAITLKCPATTAGIVENIAKQKWPTAAGLIMRHDALLDEIQESVFDRLDGECRRLCHPKRDFVLFRCSPDDLRSFSFAEMESDLRRLAPFTFSLLSAVANHRSPLKTCTAASVLLRGRNDKLPSAFAYYINGVLEFGGARKAVFRRLCELGISADHGAAGGKRRARASVRGDPLPQRKAANESFLAPQRDSDGDVASIEVLVE